MAVYARILDDFPVNCNACKLNYKNEYNNSFCGITGRSIDDDNLHPEMNDYCPLFDESVIEVLLALKTAKEGKE